MEIAESQCLERLSVSSNLIIYSERNQNGLLKVLNLTNGISLKSKTEKLVMAVFTASRGFMMVLSL